MKRFVYYEVKGRIDSDSLAILSKHGYSSEESYEKDYEGAGTVFHEFLHKDGNDTIIIGPRSFGFVHDKVVSDSRGLTRVGDGEIYDLDKYLSSVHKSK